MKLITIILKRLKITYKYVIFLIKFTKVTKSQSR